MLDIKKIIIEKFENIPSSTVVQDGGRIMSSNEMQNFFCDCISLYNLEDDESFNRALEELINEKKINEIKDDTKWYYELVE